MTDQNANTTEEQQNQPAPWTPDEIKEMISMAKQMSSAPVFPTSQGDGGIGTRIYIAAMFMAEILPRTKEFEPNKTANLALEAAECLIACSVAREMSDRRTKS